MVEGRRVHKRPRLASLRIPLLGGVLVATLLALVGRRGSRRRPTAAELMAMTDAEFEAFIRSTGIKTVTTAGLAASGDSSH
jgi:hypothetical protein